MTTETKRDLQADLALCDAATAGPWRMYGGKFGETNVYYPPYDNHDEVVSDIDADRTHDARFIAESREAWPEAIRRAIAAEEKWAKLRSVVITNATGGNGENINDWDIMRNHMDEFDSEVVDGVGL